MDFTQQDYQYFQQGMQNGTLTPQQQSLFTDLDSAGYFNQWKQPPPAQAAPPATAAQPAQAPPNQRPPEVTVYDRPGEPGMSEQPAPDFWTSVGNRTWPALPPAPAGEPTGLIGRLPPGPFRTLMVRGTQPESTGDEVTQMLSLPLAIAGAGAEQAKNSKLAGDVAQYAVPATALGARLLGRKGAALTGGAYLVHRLLSGLGRQ